METSISAKAWRGERRGRRLLRNRRGQALAEAGVVIPMLVILMMAVFEFGRAYMIANVVTNAARVGARTASLTPATLRDQDGIGTSDTHIVSAAKTMLGDIVDANLFAVTVDWIEEDGVPMVRVEVSATSGIPFALVPAMTFAMERAATFPDQGRRQQG